MKTPLVLVAVLLLFMGVGSDVAATGSHPGSPIVPPARNAFVRHGLTPDTGAGLFLGPASQTVAPGAFLTLVITGTTGSPVITADAAQVYLAFDPVYLQVVDASGAPANIIQAGAVFPSVITDQADNAAGQISFEAYTTAAFPSGSFTVATIRFKARACSCPPASTQVRFVTGVGGASDLLSGGDYLLAATSDASVILDAHPPTGVLIYLPIILNH